MIESFEPILNVVNALIAFIVLYLGIRIAISMRLTLQRRSVYFFIIAIIFFAIHEVLTAVAKSLPPLNLFSLIQEFIQLVFIGSLAVAMYLVLRSEKQEITMLHHSAERDHLTNLHNISFFRRAARQRVQHAKEYYLPLTLLMLDIDDFKRYNDTFGHEAGNTALQALAQALQSTARANDLLARYGGEEFVVIMNIGHETAVTAAERIRSNVESRCAPGANSTLRRQITVSIGVATLTHPLERLEELIEAADKALYCAKKSGRNRVSVTSC